MGSLWHIELENEGSNPTLTASTNVSVIGMGIEELWFLYGMGVSLSKCQLADIDLKWYYKNTYHLPIFIIKNVTSLNKQNLEVLKGKEDPCCVLCHQRRQIIPNPNPKDESTCWIHRKVHPISDKKKRTSYSAESSIIFDRWCCIKDNQIWENLDTLNWPKDKMSPGIYIFRIRQGSLFQHLQNITTFICCTGNSVRV